MDKFIPYEKLSKKKKREQDLRQRRTWGDLNPVTRRSPKPTVYNRNKARNWKEDSESVPCLCLQSWLTPAEPAFVAIAFDTQHHKK